MPELFVKRHGRIGRVIISNPQKLNAMTQEMWHRLCEAIEDLERDPEIRLIVLEGEGDKAFVSGADISQFEFDDDQDHAQKISNSTFAAACATVVACNKPVVAKILGVCMGGGLGLAASCDVRFCRDDARFRMPAGRLGLGYSASGVKRFISVLGLQNTLDIFFSARTFDAADALKMGFIRRVGTRETFDQIVDEWCSLVAENAPLALRALKTTVNQLLPDPDFDDLGVVNEAIAACYTSQDYREGVAAFGEKRKAIFRGI